MGGVVDRVDRLQQQHRVLGFGYAVVRKYLDDGGGREAALITYYGFLSIFPVLLLGVTLVTRVLAARPDLRQRLITAFVPSSLQSSVESAAAAMPTSAVPLTIGIIGLLYSGAGVVFSAYHTLNHLAAVPYRLRHGIVEWLLRVLVVLVLLLAGVVAVGGLTVAVTAVPGLSAVPQAAALLGSWLIAYGVLLLAARLLLSRPAPVRSLWPGAALGATAVTAVLTVGAAVLPGLVRRAGAVYGSFAAVAGMFSLLYVLSLALVFAAEVAAVRQGRLWPRALDRDRPTAADARALALMAREQERDPADRIQPVTTRQESGPPG
ncbi:YihY/virulence factor BrkB family protein [Krasilnikovia sp. MM14-A1004]|uniref:YihY/virulence factor BrkB family protein n=1 Tax=Krasilnikovia sp. MM14-A1004 TaxID=3373541 RepID=UPI00399D044E